MERRPPLDLFAIQRAARASRITWRYHALRRARERGITREQAIQVMAEGEIIVQYSGATPYPMCLMMTRVEEERPLYVALGYEMIVSTSSPCTGSTRTSGKTRGRGVGSCNLRGYTMTTTTKQHGARCAVCGGATRQTTITHEERRGENLYLFQNVPASVCDACGELWIDEEVLQQIDRLITDGVPVRTVEIPVYEFPPAPTAAT